LCQAQHSQEQGSRAQPGRARHRAALPNCAVFRSSGAAVRRRVWRSPRRALPRRGPPVAPAPSRPESSQITRPHQAGRLGVPGAIVLAPDCPVRRRRVKPTYSVAAAIGFAEP
jgi:hypothetical protein